MSFRALAEDLASDYSALYGKPFDEARMLPEYDDFKAKCWALAAATDEVFGYETGCLWPLRLFDRMTYAQIDSLTEEAVEWSLGVKEPYIDTWESPVMGKAGKICVSFSRGIRIAPELPQLYSALAEKGIGLDYDRAALESMAAEAYGKRYGAREIRRVLREHVEDAIAAQIIDRAAVLKHITVTAENGTVKVLFE